MTIFLKGIKIMLNEDKIRLMTKLAIYEKGDGREAIKSNKYYKKDYVGIMMINTAITVTIAFILGLVLWIIYKVDFFVEKIVSINLFTLGKKILVIYIIFFIVYMLVSYVVYSIKYLKMQDMNTEYTEDLKELYMIYKREEKNKSENKLGGIDSDDETFSF